MSYQARTQHAGQDSGFTLIELMVVILIMGVITALVVPNLGVFVPKARIDAAAKHIISNIDFARSEARIQGKTITLELDLENAAWRYVFPPEDQLTSDQDVETLEIQYQGWKPLEDDVKFLGAGNPFNGIAREKTFSMVFDENGFTSDQAVFLGLISNPDMTWTVQVHGLTGRCEIVRDYEGNEHPVDETGEGMF